MGRCLTFSRSWRPAPGGAPRTYRMAGGSSSDSTSRPCTTSAMRPDTPVAREEARAGAEAAEHERDEDRHEHTLARHERHEQSGEADAGAEVRRRAGSCRSRRRRASCRPPARRSRPRRASPRAPYLRSATPARMAVPGLRPSMRSRKPTTDRPSTIASRIGEDDRDDRRDRELVAEPRDAWDARVVGQRLADLVAVRATRRRSEQQPLVAQPEPHQVGGHRAEQQRASAPRARCASTAARRRCPAQTAPPTTPISSASDQHQRARPGQSVRDERREARARSRAGPPGRCSRARRGR